MPTTPTALQVACSSRTAARLTWTDADGNDAVEIYRGLEVSPETADFVAVVPQGVQLYKDEVLIQGTTYFYWLRGRANGEVPSDLSIAATITTLGAAGNPGDAAVASILAGAKSRIRSVLPADWTELTYVRNPEKNPAMKNTRGWGVLIGPSEPGAAPVFGSYTQTMQLQVVLMMTTKPGKGDSEVEAAELEAQLWVDRFLRDFLYSGLYLGQYVLKVSDPTTGAPERFQDGEAFTITISFPVQYRNRLRP